MYKEVTVNAGEDLLPEVAEHLQLTHLNIGKDGLRLTLQGKLKSLRTGSQRTLQNPKMGQWVWQLHRMKLFGLLAVMAVAVAGLAWRKKKLQPI